jgi:hypothetical protein
MRRGEYYRKTLTPTPLPQGEGLKAAMRWRFPLTPHDHPSPRWRGAGVRSTTALPPLWRCRGPFGVATVERGSGGEALFLPHAVVALPQCRIGVGRQHRRVELAIEK